MVYFNYTIAQLIVFYYLKVYKECSCLYINNNKSAQQHQQATNPKAQQC